MKIIEIIQEQLNSELQGKMYTEYPRPAFRICKINRIMSICNMIK